MFGIFCVVVATIASSLKPVFAAIAMTGVDKPKLECACPPLRPVSAGSSLDDPPCTDGGGVIAIDLCDQRPFSVLPRQSADLFAQPPAASRAGRPCCSSTSSLWASA